jgi:hypothetical protein
MCRLWGENSHNKGSQREGPNQLHLHPFSPPVLLYCTKINSPIMACYGICIWWVINYRKEVIRVTFLQWTAQKSISASILPVQVITHHADVMMNTGVALVHWYSTHHCLVTHCVASSLIIWYIIVPLLTVAVEAYLMFLELDGSGVRKKNWIAVSAKRGGEDAVPW